MTVAARIFKQGVPYSLLPDGVSYADPIRVPTYAAVRTMTVAPPMIVVGGRTTDGDGAGGPFIRDDAFTADDDGVLLSTQLAGVGYRRVFAGSLQTVWYGVKADALQITDGVRTLGSAKLTRAAGGFTPAMVGRTVLLREPDPTRLAAGTMTFLASLNASAAGAGTNILVDLPPISGSDPNAYQPREGGAIYVNGKYYAAIFGNASIQGLLIFDATAGAQAAQPWYTEVQRILTVTAYVSPTELTLSATASVSQTGVWGTISSDDAAAHLAAYAAAQALGIKDVEEPPGKSGIASTIGLTGYSDLTIWWQRGSGLVDLRKVSTEYPFPNAQNYYGAFSLVSCSRVKLINWSYDANVPCLGVVHSAGGSINNSGSRSGLVIFGSDDCYADTPTKGGFGARDEHFYIGGDSKRCTVLTPDIVLTNNASLNWNSGAAAISGTLIGGRLTGLTVYCAGFRALGTEITAEGHARMEAGIGVVPIGHGYYDVTLRDSNSVTTNSPAIGIAGATDPNASVTIKAKIRGFNGGGWVAGGATVKVDNNAGQVNLDLDIDECTNAAPGGRFVAVAPAVTGKTHIRGSLRGRAGSNMTVGVDNEAGGTAGQLTIDPNVVYGESITTRLVPSTALGRIQDHQTIAATGATAVRASADVVIVTANGAVAATLSDPTKVPGHFVTVKNDTTQAGTTTIGTAAGNIDGSATLARTGASRAAMLFSDGANWKVVSIYL